MALKQLLFADDAFNRLPSLIHLIQSEVLPENELTEIFPHVSNLIYGNLQQKKMGLAILKCCLIYLHQNNRINNNIDYLLKWWKGVVNCMKSRYTADTTYRLACVNATILSQICGNYVDLLMEGRANVPVLVAACTAHVCAESFELLHVLTRMFPSHIGKHYEAVKSFCLSHVQDEYSEKCAEILAQLTCVGPAGKQSVNYTNSWNKAAVTCLDSVNNMLFRVVGQEVKPVANMLVLPSWQFTGTLGDVNRANKEITFLTKYLSHLLNMTVEVSTIFPLKSLRSMIEYVSTAYNESAVYSGTTDNFSRRVVVNHAVKEVLSALILIVPVLNTSVFLVQQDIENLIYNLLKRSCHVTTALELLSVMINVGCTLTSLPFVVLIDLLSLNSLQIKGPVTKKQKTEQFNTFTFETSTLGSHKEGDMVCVLKLLCQVLRSCGTRLPQLKVNVLREKCQDILTHKESFSSRVLQHTYQVLNTLSSQSFEFSSVLTLSSSAHESSLHTFFCNETNSVEPHLHPERHSFRNSAGTVGAAEKTEKESIDNSEGSMWGNEDEVLFSNMPHSNGVNCTDVTMEQGEEEELGDHVSGAESEEETGDNLGKSESRSDKITSDRSDSEKLKEAIKSKHDSIINLKENMKPAQEEEIIKSVEKEDQSEALFDILSSFVDEPASEDEMCA